MKKQSFMEKLVKKDYNNELEKKLEQKTFEENVQSNLLSILYKIETAYKDYETVKRDVETKEEYIEQLIKIIEEKCKKIKLIRMESEERKIHKNNTFYVDKTKGEIECYPIERKLLYAIWKISKKDTIIKDKYYLENIVLSDLLNAGNNIQKVEPIRDFNGYSWTTLNTEIESTAHNLIYQILRNLVGNKLLEKWVYEKENKTDYYKKFLEKIKKEYGEKNSEEIIETIIKTAIMLEIKFDKNKIENFKEDKKETENELKTMQDKHRYVEEITKRKLQILEEIKEIDNKINNKDLLEQEYIIRNEILPLNKKIFSMRVLSNIMIEEREKKYKKIEELNEIMKPTNFVKHYQELEEKNRYLKYLEVENNQQEIENTLTQIQKIFLKCFQIKIEKANTKQEIIELIYELRYYLLLPFNVQNNVIEKIEETEELQNTLQETLKKIIEKAKNTKTIVEVTKNDDYEYEIWKNILQLRVIKLEDISLKITKDKEKYFMQIFDEGAFEEKTQIFINTTINEKQIKINKKIKIFE